MKQVAEHWPDLTEHWLDLANSKSHDDECWSAEYMLPPVKPTVWAAPWEYDVRAKRGSATFIGKVRTTLLAAKA